MATSQMSEVIQRLRRSVPLQEVAGLTDEQLLEDYISRRDEAALAILVRRHGPMVWGVCRRVLRNYHDAEDAFQATFLVFVRKAASIASRQLLANWLYGVAYQTALKARATVAKRKARERQVAEMPEPAVTEPDLWWDLQPLLDQELSHLPDKYRVVILLCDLQAKTRKEAAGQLGVPEGTVAGRLARARVMLVERLARHGLAVSGGAMAAVLAQNVATAGVPPSVVSSTIKAASVFAAGQAAAARAVSVKVAALAEGVLRSMFLTKLKVITVPFMVAGLIGAAAWSYQTQAAERPPSQTGAQTADRDQPTAKSDEQLNQGKNEQKEGQDKPLKKAEQAIIADFKKLNAKEATITIATYTNGAPGNTEHELAEAGDLELTRSLAKGVKVFVVEVKDSKDRDLKDKVRKEIKLEDLEKLKPNKMWVYHNEEADGSMGRIVMEIIVFAAKDK
jgi:RNA polymerase sigma factor (sigma-70 family)